MFGKLSNAAIDAIPVDAPVNIDRYLYRLADFNSDALRCS